MTWKREDITKQFYPIVDNKLKSIRSSWFSSEHPEISYKQFVPVAEEWFKSTTVNDIQGWKQFPFVDVTMGNTHYIESFALKHGWTGFQILKNEYAYYTLMGKHGTDIDNLEPNKPLIITMPHWEFCDLRPEWQDLLNICEKRNIDIHIDMAWIVTAKDINIDFSHPAIKSFGMSLSKLNMQWARVGLRWSRQKSMDSITIFNNYYHQTNTVMTSAGLYAINQINRDYLWDTYKNQHHNLCQELDLLPTKIIHIAKDSSFKSLGIGNMLSKSTPD